MSFQYVEEVQNSGLEVDDVVVEASNLRRKVMLKPFQHYQPVDVRPVDIEQISQAKYLKA